MKDHKTNLWLAVSIILVSCLHSCIPFQEVSRVYSPDSTKFVLKYYHKDVIWSAGQAGSTSVLKTTQSIKKANKYSIPNGNIDRIYWKDDSTLIAEENFAEFKRQGNSLFKDSVFSLNDVKLKIVQKDPLDSGYLREIIYRETSPDEQKELILYTYIDPHLGNYLSNISVININDTIPKYGNFYISAFNSKLNISWQNPKTMIFIVPNDLYFPPSHLKYYLVKNRLQINYKIYVGGVESK